MGGKFRVVTQVLCALVLALSLSLATAVPMMAAEFPSISPDTLEYDLDDPAEVITTIDWGIANYVDKVTDDDGDLEEGLYDDYIVLEKHLIILDDYLASELTDIGDSVELIIKFDVGAASLNITAIGTQPSISPTTAQYDLDDPADVETTVTWGIASDDPGDIAITENGNSLTQGNDYAVGATVGGEATLTILDDYLASELTDIGEEVVLTIEFDPGEDATFTITAIGTQPSIDPTTAQYNIDSPADVKTKITWGSATDMAAPVDDDGHTLTTPSEYTRIGTDLTIGSAYLASKLNDIGEDVVLTIDFNVGGNATFTITATGTNARISSPAKDYDLDNPADVTTTITYGTAGVLESISENGNDLTPGVDYTVVASVVGEATLTILDGYLEDELTDIGDDVVLTIEFDLGSNATFTITAIGIQPKISPPTEDYDLDNPADAATTVTWGTASAIVSIVDDDQYTLIKDADYTVAAINADSATLTLAEPYLEGKHMDIGDSLGLTIDFNIGLDATFTVTPMGIQPSIYPVTADHDVIDRNDVTTIITWGSAASVVSIVDDDAYLLAEGMHYTVTPITPGVSSANLTILSSTYLAGKLGSFGERLELTIGFDVGRDATLTITVPEVCFIATAAYGTPMAEEIQVLREFRDEYMLTNPLGQALVDIYYRVSPPIAEFITEHPSLKPMVRAGLFPAVAMSAVGVNTSPVEKMVVVGLLVLVVAAVAVWATRRRGRGPEYT
ncbi:MAG: X2-like carbohydrate binding domain-containing protein [Dehalococcoidia bacterium]